MACGIGPFHLRIEDVKTGASAEVVNLDELKADTHTQPILENIYFKISEICRITANKLRRSFDLLLFSFLCSFFVHYAWNISIFNIYIHYFSKRNYNNILPFFT